MNVYTESLKLHNLKYSASKFETICITTAQFLEDMIKFKLSDGIKLLFDINKKEIEIIEAERKIPGRELSYIYKVQEKL